MIKFTKISESAYCYIVFIIANILALVLYIPFYIIEVLVKLGSNIINYLINLWRIFTKNKDTKL